VNQETKNKLIKLLGVNSGDYKLFQSKDSLRLTNHGLHVFKDNFTSYTFTLDNQITTGQIIHLQRTMNMPYFFNKKKVVLFSERDAFLAKLGGVEAWIVSK